MAEKNFPVGTADPKNKKLARHPPRPHRAPGSQPSCLFPKIDPTTDVFPGFLDEVKILHCFRHIYPVPSSKAFKYQILHYRLHYNFLPPGGRPRN